MRLGSTPWLRGVFLATVLVAAAVAIYVFAFQFFNWLESDACVPALLAQKSIEARSPIVDNWYYANGDIWLLAPHLFALLPVAVLGPVPLALLVGNVMGFAAEIAALVLVFRRYYDARWVAWFAAIVTMIAWSKSHVAYEYIQLSYGLSTVLCIVVFHLLGTLADNARPARWLAISLLIVALTVNNPTRCLVFTFAPVVVAVLWPWQGVTLRRRAAIAALTTASWAIGFVIYSKVLATFIAWSTPRGHVGFVIVGFKQIIANLKMLGRGLVILCAGGGGFETAVKSGIWVPGALLVVGALVLVMREALSRTWTPLRWMSVVVLAQTGIVLGPLVLGNVLDYPEAGRYLMTSLVSLAGLAVILAVRTLGESSKRWRHVAIAWLVAVPIGALVAAPDAAPPRPSLRMWPDAPELRQIADELERRHLTHGFAERLSANVLTLDSGGRALTCRSTTYDVLMPQRWLSSTDCYTPETLPDRFYVVIYQQEFERSMLRATFPTELEEFHVGDTYEVHVYRTKDAPLTWMNLPIPSGELTQFPLWIPAIHRQLLHRNVALEGGQLVATGEPGLVLYGPYLDLPAGEYVARWMGNGVPSKGQLSFRVTSGFGKRKIANVMVDAATILPARHEVVRIPFRLTEPLPNVDFRIVSEGGARVSLHELVLERVR